MTRTAFHTFLGVSALAEVCAARHDFYANGPTADSGAFSRAYAWSGSWWSDRDSGAAASGALPTLNSAVFSAGKDASAANLTITGSTGKIASVIVEDGDANLLTLARVHVGGSPPKTANGTVLIAVRPEFPFTWDSQSGAAVPETCDSEFHIHGTRFAAVLETAHPADLPGATAADPPDGFRAAMGVRSTAVRPAASTPTATNPGIVGRMFAFTDTEDISTVNPPRRFMRLQVSAP